MTVCVCIASRGRPALLHKTLTVLCDGMTLPDTQIVVAIDLDDPERTIDAPYPPQEQVVWSLAEREDSLGAKYNRAQQAVSADLYVLWADDMVMPDKGWDEELDRAARRISITGGIVLFGQIPGVLQPGLAMTNDFIKAQGFFNVPYFPFWWGETWPMEIATMVGCYTHANVRVELLQEIKGKSRGVREITFWAELFDRMRSSRIAVAQSIINKSELPNKADLLARIPAVAEQWLQSNSVLRDPVRAKELEQHYSFDAPEDERYLRMKAKAEVMLQELRQ